MNYLHRENKVNCGSKGFLTAGNLAIVNIFAGNETIGINAHTPQQLEAESNIVVSVTVMNSRDSRPTEL